MFGISTQKGRPNCPAIFVQSVEQALFSLTDREALIRWKESFLNMQRTRSLLLAHWGTDFTPKSANKVSGVFLS
ncbi:hypothetical protein [Paenibacillus planticolens]|uniref:Uncharacterized protein n=1 Tax=Paenibacillus planticolens TaxID=2654976 RepID=A0ABX1ZPA7_9BACL|nr:hypothetical protein [Paenibacillus planticolens]NOV00727.1 hypothetical protein [Paenibacillus planticolens]